LIENVVIALIVTCALLVILAIGYVMGAKASLRPEILLANREGYLQGLRDARRDIRRVDMNV